MILNQQGKIVKRSIGGCLETVGLPSYAAAEMLGSKELKNEEADIMPELPPQIRSLEVVGRKLQTHCSKMSNQVGRTEALGASDAVEVAQSTVTIQQPVSGLGVRINGINFWPHNPEFSPTIDRTFASQPFQRHLRPIIRIENIGSQELSLQWKKVNFFSNNNTLMEADPDDFVFDVDPFVLLPGEFRDVTVLFHCKAALAAIDVSTHLFLSPFWFHIKLKRSLYSPQRILGPPQNGEASGVVV